MITHTYTATSNITRYGNHAVRVQGQWIWPERSYSMNGLHQELAETVADLLLDLDKFESKGNKAAGTRARVKCQEVKALCNEIRKAVQDAKKEK